MYFGLFVTEALLDTTEVGGAEKNTWEHLIWIYMWGTR
jgi:hypothetical protein